MLGGMPIASSITILLWVSTAAHCFDCGIYDDRTVPGIILHLDRLDSLLPSVPAQQEQLMANAERRGLAGALDALDPVEAGKAFNELQSNPYYHLRRTKNALKRARDAMDIVLVDAKTLRRDNKFRGVGFPYRFYEDDKDANAEAVKLDHAAFVFSVLEQMEIELSDFIHIDGAEIHGLVSDETRNDIKADSSGYVAELGSYAQCKLAGVIAHEHKAQNGHDVIPK